MIVHFILVFKSFYLWVQLCLWMMQKIFKRACFTATVTLKVYIFFFFQGMKSIRVKLMRQMKEESERFRALKAQKEKEIYQLKEQVSYNLIRSYIVNSLLSGACTQDCRFLSTETWWQKLGDPVALQWLTIKPIQIHNPLKGACQGAQRWRKLAWVFINIGSLSNGDGIENGKKAVGLQQQQVYFKLNIAHKACARN